MRKSYLVVLFVCLAFLFVSTASAEMYVSGKIGYVMTSDTDVEYSGFEVATIEWDGGFGMGLAVGTSIDAFRIEGEFEYRKVGLDTVDFKMELLGPADLPQIDEGPVDADLTTLSLLVNGYYDFATGSAFKPYVGAGLGFAKHDLDDVDDTVFAYQVTLGTAWALSDTMDLDFAYRYFATADADFAGLDASYGSHNLSVGMRFKF